MCVGVQASDFLVSENLPCEIKRKLLRGLKIRAKKEFLVVE